LDIQAFRDPGKSYRPSPFWSWNDALVEEELLRQVQEMKKQGFGGYFMHSRVGLKTPYLSDEWIERIKAVLDEGKKLGMETWLYDEDKWPSGAAGGIITADNEEFRAKYVLEIAIEAAEVERYLADRDVLGVFEIRMNSKGPEGYERIVEPGDAIERRSPDVRWTAFKMMSQAPSAWYNNATYADLLDPAAVGKFMSVTHEYYKEHLGNAFGEYVAGIFTDEPQFIGTALNTLPWTAGFKSYFETVEGYDLVDFLPSLFCDCGDYHAIRYAYFRAIARRFVETYSKPVYEFCENNNLQYTGHYFEEDTMYRQATSVGAVMPHYEYMHIPGIDHLCRQLTIPTDSADDHHSEQTPTPLTMKQVSSAAHQFGRKRILCEIFGVSGHSMSFEDQKWLADYNFVLGITFLCQHLVLYSMVGERKRDYPPTISYHQPYWEHYHLMNDYFARASWVCSQGHFVADTLVLHPIGSLWATYARSHRFDVGHYDRQLIELTLNLLSCQVGFDFGDEMIMENNASVRTEDGEALLTIASGGKYKVVIVPPSLTWSTNTVNLLQRFADKRGKILFVGEKPRLVDGKAGSGEWELLLQQSNSHEVDNTYGELKSWLSGLLADEVVITGADGKETKDIYVHARRDRHEYYYFLANTSRETASNIRIALPVQGQLKQLDLHTGEIRDMNASTTQAGMEVETMVYPCGSIACYVDTSADAPEAEQQMPVFESEIRLPSTWQFKRLHPNGLTLDYCRYSVNQGEWSEVLPVWKIRKKMWHDAGLGDYDGVQPWVMERAGIQATSSSNLRLSFAFQCATKSEAIQVVIEQAYNWTLKVNGNTVSTVTKEHCWDKQFGLINIARHVVQGGNRIELECAYRHGIEIEDIYLVGEFGVRSTGSQAYALTDEPDELEDGSWVNQGYPFYSGNMVYRSFIKAEPADRRRYFLRLNNPRGTLYRIKVNHHEAIALISQPWEADITDYCVNDANLVEIEVAGSLRNTFGPLHHKQFNPAWCGPEAFAGEQSWVDHYQLEDYGLIDGVSFIVRTEMG